MKGTKDNRKIWKYIRIGLIVVAGIIALYYLCGIIFAMIIDYNHSLIPSKQDGTVWVSEEPDIMFEVSDEYVEKYGGNCKGVMTVNGEEVVIRPTFGYGGYVDFGARSGSAIYISGNAEYSKDKMVFTVEEDNVFGGKYTTITFIKQPASD